MLTQTPCRGFDSLSSHSRKKPLLCPNYAQHSKKASKRNSLKTLNGVLQNGYSEVSPGVFEKVPKKESKIVVQDMRPEREIQQDIARWLRKQGYEYCWPRMDKPTGIPRGYPDFCIHLPDG